MKNYWIGCTASSVGVILATALLHPLWQEMLITAILTSLIYAVFAAVWK